MLNLQLSTPINITFSSHHIIINKPFLSTQNCTAQTRIFRYRPNDHFIFTHSCNSSHYSLLKSCLAVGKPKYAASENDGERNQIELPGGLDPELMPKHVAIIMDGNRRWAKNRGLNPQDGHKAGKEALRVISAALEKYGVKVLSVFAFSTENWTRPKEEGDWLMKLFEVSIQTDFEELMQKGWPLTILGDRSRFPHSLRNLLSSSEEHSKANKGLNLVMAMNYSGRYDVTQATKKIAKKVKDGILQVEDIDRDLFEQHLETNRLEFPNPDLLIRTGSELRVSNYMLWQLAYTELYFSEKMFPDFNEEDVVEALASFQLRQRRFGGYRH